MRYFATFLCFVLFTISIFLGACSNSENLSAPVPNYLADYSEQYAENPRAANLAWFKDAKYGLFIHYGLYALMEEGEWVQLRHDPPVPVAEYAKLAERFTAENFDADFIADFVLKAGMKYVTITSKHHEGYSLFDTAQSDFKTTNSPCGRDLIAELAEACDKRGVGLFLYYSLAADWKHPYFYSREAGWDNARPAYDKPQPEYLYKTEADFQKYIDFAHAQIAELLTNYPTIAGIWLDPVMGYYSRPDLFPIEETYALIRRLSPHALISFKQGANGDEDFMAPERGGEAKVGDQFEVARRAYELNKNKSREICDTMQPHLKGFHGGSTWGYNKQMDGKHLTVEQVLEKIAAARAIDANLLLNIGPKPDGAFPQHDIDTLLEVGRRLKQRGF
jgi:alpha-L-fucosidase